MKLRTLSSAAQAVTSKFAPKRDGPYRIAKRISPVSYQIADVKTDELLSVRHVSDLQPWIEKEPEGVIDQPIRPLRKRGRPRRILDNPSLVDVGPLTETSKSKGGACSANGPMTRSRALVGGERRDRGGRGGKEKN